jgi:hypothetical protein
LDGASAQSSRHEPEKRRADTFAQRNLFEPYASVLDHTPLWPTVGNHDVYNGMDPLPYQRVWTLPTLGEAGGAPSHTEFWYSFDHGQVHFVCLESMWSMRKTGWLEAMLEWLARDLAIATADDATRWIVAFWHHPPYSKGSHDSDSEVGSIRLRLSSSTQPPVSPRTRETSTKVGVDGALRNNGGKKKIKMRLRVGQKPSNCFVVVDHPFPSLPLY